MEHLWVMTTLGFTFWSQNSAFQIRSLLRDFAVLRLCFGGTGYKIRLTVTEFQAEGYHLERFHSGILGLTLHCVTHSPGHSACHSEGAQQI